MMLKITITVLLVTISGLIASAQRGFYKVFQEKDYHSTRDLIAIDENHIAFITSDFFYRIDGSGKILLQKELNQGTSSDPQSVIADQEGNFWIASAVYDAAYNPRKVLNKLAPDGQILKTVDFGVSGSFGYMNLLALANNTFILAYEDRSQSGNSAIRVLMMDKNGNSLWNKQVTDTIYNTHSIKNGPGNTADIYYELKADRKGQITTIDANGNISKKDISLDDPPQSDYYTTDFVRTNDGFVFCGSENKAYPLLEDGLIYKTDNDGNVQWKQIINIKQSDNFLQIRSVPDGYILLGLSGIENITSDIEGDIVVMKTDKQGNRLWTKAYGGPRSDYARFLGVLEQHIVFAGQSSYAGTSVSTPFVCKTDLQGIIPASLPFEPLPEATMKMLATPNPQHPVKLVQSAPGPNASVISGGNLLNTDDDQTYPIVMCNDRNSNQIWYKQLSTQPAPLKVLKQVRLDEYIAITEMKSIFSNGYDVYKLDGSGKIIWTKQVSGNAIQDVIGTSDGGILITGTFDISYINYETLLIKMDASGNVQWNRKIGDLRLWETGRRVIETPEKDFLIIGSAVPEFNITSSVYVLKIDRQGYKLWSKTFAQGVTIDAGYDAIITPDQGYLFLGTSNEQPFTNKDLLLIKTDKNGNQQWRKTYDLHLMDEGYQLMNSAGGGFIILGTTAEPQAGALEKYIYVMKTDANGRNEGTKYYGKKGLQTMNPSITILPSGDTILTGTKQDAYGRETIFMAMLEDFVPGNEPEHFTMNLYPNPSNGSSSLVFNTAETGLVTIHVYDQAGRMIKQINRTKTAVSFKEDLDMSALPTGNYFVTVWFNGKRDNIKWLIVR